MAYDEISRCGAIICTHVAKEKKPILRAVRDRPIRPEDSGWQFTCGEGGHGGKHAQLWALNEIADLDSTILAIADSEICTAFERDSGSDTWTQVKYTR